MGKWLKRLTEGASAPDEAWSPAQEASAKEIHDQAMLRLAAKVPAGSHAWSKAERPDLWAATEAAYDRVRAAFAAEYFAGALATIRVYEEANIALFRAFSEAQQPRWLADMPINEAEATIIRTFNARRVDISPKRDKRPNTEQIGLLKGAV